MPKKSATTRSRAQRSKPKAQKSFELVREASEEPKLTTNEGNATASTQVATATATAPEVPVEKETGSPIRKGSASARLAARRQAGQKARGAAPLITSEHYAYVFKDLITIGILAFIMVAAIIILYFVLGTSV